MCVQVMIPTNAPGDGVRISRSDRPVASFGAAVVKFGMVSSRGLKVFTPKMISPEAPTTLSGIRCLRSTLVSVRHKASLSERHTGPSVKVSDVRVSCQGSFDVDFQGVRLRGPAEFGRAGVGIGPFERTASQAERSVGSVKREPRPYVVKGFHAPAVAPMEETAYQFGIEVASCQGVNRRIVPILMVFFGGVRAERPTCRTDNPLIRVGSSGC